MVDFLVIGNGSSALYNNVFPLIKERKIVYGYSIKSGYRYFEVPDDYEFYGTIYKEEDGKRFIAVSGVRWFTSMRDILPPRLDLKKKYIAGEYKKFDNYDAINVDRTEDIPYDYDGVMGVPVTFLDKWNKEQFDVIGITHTGATKYDIFKPYVDGQWKYPRLLIKRR